jgi:hypothetical protein
MTGLAFGLRLLIGTTLYVVLPLDGYDEPDDRAGYVFTDAHRRDDQAWELAASTSPISAAFNRNYYTDQYGGLLALSALTYRLLSPDAHRPLLILTLAALFSALGVPFFFRSAGLLWGATLSRIASWLYCLYPESVLTGGAQMREPFLLTFIAISLWGMAAFLDERRWPSAAWMVVGLAGLVVVSPGIALAMLLFLAIWIRVRGAQLQAGLVIWIAGGLLGLAALLFLAWSVRAGGSTSGTPVNILFRWFQDAVSLVIYQLERGSGQVQNVFDKLFPAAQFLFVVAYGVTQPLLPPAFFEPTTTTWHLIGILRSVGWYLLLPLLLYAPAGIWRTERGPARRVWLWMTGFVWLWILICAIRAGGDQWDNPRYRLIFFGIQALVAARAWLAWRVGKDPWLPRVAAVEVVCLLLFGQWYVARYYLVGVHLPILMVIALSIASTVLIFGGSAALDWWHKRRAGS